MEKASGDHGGKEREKDAEKATAKENFDDDHDGTGAEKVDLPMPTPMSTTITLMDTPKAAAVTMAGHPMAAIILVGRR